MSQSIAYSILVPNYNYGRYIKETIDSALLKADKHDELVMCDNASTDDSVAVAKGLGDPRVRVEVNPCNVGFAANLERVASFARGRRMILLSSDDRIGPEALPAYRRLETALGSGAQTSVWGTTWHIIDGEGNRTGQGAVDQKLWHDANQNAELSQAVGYPVLELPAAELLRRSLLLLRTPMPFMSTCYSKALHDAVGGYSGGRLVNPDKWFLWKALGSATMAYMIDAPLFDYRVHGAGQGAQERASGALKHLTDEYIATFNLPPEVLQAAGLDRDKLAAAFIEQDIALRGLVALASGERTGARRMVHFGQAAYPALMQRNPKVWALRGLLALGPLGTAAARVVRRRAEAAWQQKQTGG